jgi:broad specificity phosphatase PhoE
MTKILLTRHGHVDGIRPARLRGRAELALTERGLAEADALARRIAANWKPVAVFTSPLQRCVLTGAKIAAACGIKGEVREGLGDIDYGAWQMRTHDEVSAESPDAYRQWRSAPQLTRFPKGGIAAGRRGAVERRAARGAGARPRADGGAGRP